MPSSTRPSGSIDRPALPRRRPALPRPIRVLLKNPAALFATLVMLFLLYVVICPQSLTSFDPIKMQLAEKYASPGAAHLLGADQFGRDIFARVLYGARISLGIGFGSTLLSLIAGAIIGIIAGYYGGWLDRVLTILMDMLMAFPSILLALVMVASLGAGKANTIIALSVAMTPNFARQARASVLAVRGKEYIQAANAGGLPAWYIMARHVLPNIMAPLLITASLSVGVAILSEASLSYLGLGVPPPDPSWGTIVNEGMKSLSQAPWVATAGGGAVTLAVLAVNLLGDFLRDVYDPRLKGVK